MPGSTKVDEFRGSILTGLMAMGCAEDARSESEGSLAEGEPEGPARGREGERWRFGRGTTKLVVGLSCSCRKELLTRRSTTTTTHYN